jgi:flagellar motor protein MotB
MRRLQTRHAAHTRVSRERWLVSYADFMTLLFAFFAMMYAISSVDSLKLSAVARALQVAFDDSTGGRSACCPTAVCWCPASRSDRATRFRCGSRRN